MRVRRGEGRGEVERPVDRGEDGASGLTCAALLWTDGRGHGLHPALVSRFKGLLPGLAGFDGKG